MLKIYNLKDKQEYIREVATLTQNEWGESNLSSDEFKSKINEKVSKISKSFDNRYYCNKKNI